MPYVPSRFAYRRRPTIPVMVGRVQVGGTLQGRPAPLVVQSMCTTRTTDVAATVAQCATLARAGCEIVRVTAPGLKDAQALKDIRAGFTAAGFRDVPLVADIHFMPAAAMEAVEHVEKVRVNPGNFADKKAFKVVEYTDAQYREEVERMAERFAPLVRRAKALGRSLRIGTNHGSLSDRIMNRHGDSPAGMVESALEFVRICESEGFRDLIISMKASNPKVMVQAYRLLVDRLEAGGHPPYPLHLGVTEAGDGEDGRTKSAAGIGALLEDGLGDTIRVSLTEPPECEIPVARALAARYADWSDRPAPAGCPPEAIDPFRFQRRAAEITRLGHDLPIGGTLLPRVLAPATAPAGTPPADALVGDGPGQVPLAAAPGALLLLDATGSDPVATLRRGVQTAPAGAVLGIGDPGGLGETRAYRLLAALSEERFRTGDGQRHALCLALPRQRDELAIAAIAGGLLIDGLGDCLHLPAAPDPRRLGFTLLQAVKARQTRTDYVACPSCGRTQFDLMEVTAHIRAVTGHLDGVTIAIMGCIVNGPGEMADADFGYVGSGPGKIDLYRRKDKVRAGLPEAAARDELVKLIKEAGMWKEPAAS
jgi:(E)-4-hydroxy-3-methylbut-2-enyl-diphosphate synthase